MRARNVVLALLIIAVGLTITAHHRGVFSDRSQAVKEVAQTVESFSGYWPGGADLQEVERFTHRLPLEGQTSLVIENPNGEVSVTGQAQDYVQVEVVRYGREGEAGRARDREQARFQAYRVSDAVKVRVVGRPCFWSATRFDLRITAPHELDVNIRVASGPVRVQGMDKTVAVTGASGGIRIVGAAQATATSASGDISLGAIHGPVQARAASGSLTMKDISGQVSASAISGDIRARDLRGPLSASTISGTLTLENFAGPRAALKNTSGSLRVSLAQPLTGHLSARTVSGSIRATIPPDSDCTVDLESVSGDIGAHLPLRQEVHQRGHVSGLVGAGRGRLELRSVSGSLTVSTAGEPRAAE